MVDFADNHFDRNDKPFRLRQRTWPLFALRSRMSGRRLRRIALALATLVVTLCLFGAVAGSLLFLRLSRGPIAVSLETQVAKALAARVKHGFHFVIGSTAVQSTQGRPALVVRQLLVQDEVGRAIIRAPEATLSVDPMQMLAGTIVPTRLEVHDVTVRLAILPDGDVALSAGTDETLPFRLSEALEGAAPSPATSRAADPAATGSIGAEPARPGLNEIERLAQALVPLLDKFTGADEALGGFDRLGVVRGLLVLDDRSHNSVKIYRNLAFEFERLDDGAARMSLSADGPAGRWTAIVSGARQTNGRRALALEVRNLSLDELRSVPALRDRNLDTDLPMTASLNVSYDPAGALAGLNGALDFGRGYFRLDDPDHEPVMVERVATAFRFDPVARDLDVEASAIETDNGTYQFKGQLSAPTPSQAAWGFKASGKGTVLPERPNEAPIAIEGIDAALRFDLQERHLSIEKLTLSGPQVAMGLTADIHMAGSGPRLSARATAGRMPATILLRLWPTVLSASVRSWLLANLQAGTVEHGVAVAAIDEADIAKIKAGHSVADDHLRVDYAVSGMTLGFMAGVPPLRGLNGTGIVTGDTSRLTIARGLMDVSPGHQLTLSDGSLVVPSTDPKPTPAVITAHVSGGVDALAELLARDALKTYAGIPPEAASAKGQIDGTLTVGLELGARARSDDVKIGANAKLTGLSIANIVGKQDLTDGNIALVLDKTGLRAKGDAVLAGAPTTLDIKKPAGTAPGEANVVMTFDEAARLKAGLNFGRALGGAVTAKITTVLGTSDHKASVDLDLSRATLTNIVPGLSKAAGKPGRITLAATQRDDGMDLDNIVCDIGAFQARGSADLDGNGNFQAAKLSQLRLSPGDDVKLDANQGPDGLKLVVRGANLDSRPFLKSLSDADGSDAPGKDLDLDLHANVLTGQNSQAMTGVDLKVVRRGGQIRKIALTGKTGRAPVTIISSPQGNVLTVNATSGDAGATLEFLDLYGRLAGGQLDTTIRMMNGRWDGSAVVHDFGLREDPAMKKLTEESMAQRKAASDLKIDASNLTFTKLFIVFSKSGSKVDVKDGAIFSPQMGATVQGSIDFAKDRLALGGTFVPIYGVNNLFSQLPLVGPILGGGEHEGLFGLNYKITGPVANPNLTIDPLSALAPGFLRKIFGAISEATEEPAQTPARGNAAPSPRTR